MAPTDAGSQEEPVPVRASGEMADDGWARLPQKAFSVPRIMLRIMLRSRWGTVARQPASSP
jgi:hypothetical protein